MRPDFTPALKKMVDTIGTKNTYYGNKISPTLMKMLQIEVRENGAGILAPYWFGVTQRGRGPRRNNTDHGLWKKIYAWMQKRNMFKSKTTKGKINEAKSMTYYINKYGNEQFRKKVYIDIYEKARETCVHDINKSIEFQVNKISKDIL